MILTQRSLRSFQSCALSRCYDRTQILNSRTSLRYSPSNFRRIASQQRCYSLSLTLFQKIDGIRPEQLPSDYLYDKTSHWKEWFDSPEYRQAWTDDIGPLSEDPVLDRQSRFVLDLLNKLFRVGLTKIADRVSTERVHYLFDKLESLPDRSSRSMWQRAERARVLLEAMELFEEFREAPNLPLSLPLPTHATYWRVLKMYSSKYLHGANELNRNVPEICHSLVSRMKESGRLELQPTAMHWNQVLIAYANSSYEDRPIKAAQLLYDLDAQGMTDASSFSHTLRACVSMEARHQTPTPKFEQMAVSVAQRVWTGLKQSKHIDMQAVHFLHMLRVCRNFRDRNERDEWANQVINEAIQARLINVHVLNEMLQVSSSSLIQQLLGAKKFSRDPLTLIRQVPSKWIEPIAGESSKSPYEW